MNNLNLYDFGPTLTEQPNSYPGKRPVNSYVFLKDEIFPISISANQSWENGIIEFNNERISLKEFLENFSFNEKPFSIDTMFCVLGYGSNVNPVQLHTKFKENPYPLILLKGRMKNFDIVYGSHFTKYGAIPATIVQSKMTDVEMWVTLMTSEQFKIMDKSEGRGKIYSLNKIDSEVILQNGTHIKPVYSYVLKKGVLTIDGKPIRITNIDAKDRIFTSMTQTEIQNYFFSKFVEATNNTFEDLKHSLKNNDSLRTEFKKFLQSQSQFVDLTEIEGFPEHRFSQTMTHT